MCVYDGHLDRSKRKGTPNFTNCWSDPISSTLVISQISEDAKTSRVRSIFLILHPLKMCRTNHGHLTAAARSDGQQPPTAATSQSSWNPCPQSINPRELTKEDSKVLPKYSICRSYFVCIIPIEGIARSPSQNNNTQKRINQTHPNLSSISPKKYK